MDINIHQTYYAETNSEHLIEKLNHASEKQKKFSFNMENDGTFAATARFSLGVNTSMLIGAKGITVYGLFIEDSKNFSRIKLKTKLRFEIIFLALASIIGYVFMFMHLGEFPYWLFLLPLSLVVWFFFVFRWQEQSLISKIEQSLGIKEAK